MIMLLLLVVALALVFAGFYLWSKRRGLVTPAAAETGTGPGRVSRLTEAVAYVGAVLLLAGGATAVGQRWSDIPYWLQVSLFAGVAVLFLGVGVVVRRIADPAARRLVDVTWFLSVGATAAAVGVATQDVAGETAALLIGLSATGYGAVLWLLRKHALQLVAGFAGLCMTVAAAVAMLTSGSTSWLVAGLVLWAVGIGWAVLGWRHLLEPMWVSTALGVLTALVAPAVALPGEGHGWVYVLGLGTAAAAMALSVRLKHTPLLAVGTVAMFGYLTSLVVRYFADSLGVAAALAITGAVILGLAAVTARLARMVRPSRPESPVSLPKPPHDLPKAS